jgi:hypothetical protein
MSAAVIPFPPRSRLIQVPRFFTVTGMDNWNMKHAEFSDHARVIALDAFAAKLNRPRLVIEKDAPGCPADDIRLAVAIIDEPDPDAAGGWLHMVERERIHGRATRETPLHGWRYTTEDDRRAVLDAALVKFQNYTTAAEK